MGERLRVLTVKQPWADAIAHGPKRVENRTWLTGYRGPLAIHAGKTLDPGWLAAPADHPVHAWQQAAGRPVLGAVIALARLIDAHRASDGCGCGPWGEHAGATTHLVLADVEPLPEPVPFRGALGLRWAPPDLLEALRR